MKYTLAPDVKGKIDTIIPKAFSYIDKERIYCIRSLDAKTRAIARIWGFGRLFKEVAGLPVTYIIEVNAKNMTRCPHMKKQRCSYMSSCTSHAISQDHCGHTRATALKYATAK